MQNQSLKNIAFNETTIDDIGIPFRCDDDYTALLSRCDFFQYIIILAFIIIIIYHFIQKRKNACLKICTHPGYAYAWNPIETFSHRLGIVAFHIASATFIFRALFGDPIIDLKDEGTGTDAQLAILFVAFSMHPIISSLTIGQIWSYVIGWLYTWIFIAGYIMTNIPLEVEDEDWSYWNKKLMLTHLPIFLSVLYLFFRFPYLTITAIMDRKKTKVTKELWQLDYIKFLFKKNKQSAADSEIQEPESKLKKLKKRIYEPIPGFRYSARFLSIIAVGLVIVHQVASQFYMIFIGLFLPLCSQLHVTKELVENNMFGIVIDMILPDLLLSDTISDFVIWQCRSITAICIFSVVMSEVLITALCVHMLIKYRKNLVAIYKGDYTEIPRSTSSNISVVTSCVKFGGYQATYIVWGWCIQWMVILLISFLFLEIIVMPLKFGYFAILEFLIEKFGVMILTAIVVTITNIILARLVFLQDCGRSLALNNRHLLFDYIYTMFFYNMIIGIFSSILRIIKAVLSGILFLPRLDSSTLSRNFEKFDNGYQTYLNFLKVENLQTNPVLVTFVHFLQESHIKSLANRNKSSAEEEWDLSDPFLRKRLVRNRWGVAFTLVKNGGLIRSRKHFLKPFTEEIKETIIDKCCKCIKKTPEKHDRVLAKPLV